MIYVSLNFKTKKALKEAVALGKSIVMYQAGIGTMPDNGTVLLEGPHYPAPRKWRAQGTMKDGRLVMVK